MKQRVPTGFNAVVQEMLLHPSVNGRLRLHGDHVTPQLGVILLRRKCRPYRPPSVAGAQVDHRIRPRGGYHRFQKIDPFEVLLVGLRIREVLDPPAVRIRNEPALSRDEFVAYLSAEEVRLVVGRNVAGVPPEAREYFMMLHCGIAVSV